MNGLRAPRRLILRCSTKLAATFALILPAAVQAQAFQCRAPQVSAVPAIAPDGPRRVLPVTGYTLALSWSPEFCKPRQGTRAHAFQCAGNQGSFGLIVHGLWPESGGGWPQWCEAGAALTPAEVRGALCMMPSARLVARQWAKHGACMTKRPETYLGVTRILWQSLQIPDYDALSREQGLTAGRIRAAFMAENPGWRADAIGVKLSARGWLEEIRLCYSARFRPVRCSAGRLGAKDSAPAKIWRGM
jgi:ribonuclease T2